MKISLKRLIIFFFLLFEVHAKNHSVVLLPFEKTTGLTKEDLSVINSNIIQLLSAMGYKAFADTTSDSIIRKNSIYSSYMNDEKKLKKFGDQFKVNIVIGGNVSKSQDHIIFDMINFNSQRPKKIIHVSIDTIAIGYQIFETVIPALVDNLMMNPSPVKKIAVKGDDLYKKNTAIFYTIGGLIAVVAGTSYFLLNSSHRGNSTNNDDEPIPLTNAPKRGNSDP